MGAGAIVSSLATPSGRDDEKGLPTFDRLATLPFINNKLFTSVLVTNRLVSRDE